MVEQPESKIIDKLKPKVLKPKPKPSCLAALVTFVGAIGVAFVTLFLSTISSCRPRFFEQPEVVETVETMPSDAVGFGSIPRTEHVKDQSGRLLKSVSKGDGFMIEWKTPVGGAAVSEQVLDAVLSRFQSLNSSGYGSPELSQHIYSIDKLLNEMRKGEFSKLERTLDRPRVGGMAVEPDVPPLPVGSGFPGPLPESPRPGGFGTGEEPVVEEVPPPQP